MHRNRQLRLAGILVLYALACGCGTQGMSNSNDIPSSTDGSDGSFVTAKYDPMTKPSSDLSKGLAQAQASGKRILLEVGGEW